MSEDWAPPICCWTRMGTESGQELACIIRRKEFERRIGGTFWWGIGTSLGDVPRRPGARRRQDASGDLERDAVEAATA